MLLGSVSGIAFLLLGIFCEQLLISTMVGALFGHIRYFSFSLHHATFSIWVYRLVLAYPPPCDLFYFGNIFTFCIPLHHCWAYRHFYFWPPPPSWAYMKYLFCLHHVTWWRANSFFSICPNPIVLENKYGGGQSKNWLYAQIPQNPRKSKEGAGCAKPAPSGRENTYYYSLTPPSVTPATIYLDSRM